MFVSDVSHSTPIGFSLLSQMSTKPFSLLDWTQNHDKQLLKALWSRNSYVGFKGNIKAQTC